MLYRYNTDVVVDQRGWWFSAPDDSYMAQDYTDCCKGYTESVEVIKKALIEQVRINKVCTKNPCTSHKITL